MRGTTGVDVLRAMIAPASWLAIWLGFPAAGRQELDLRIGCTEVGIWVFLVVLGFLAFVGPAVANCLCHNLWTYLVPFGNILMELALKSGREVPVHASGEVSGEFF